MTGSEKLSTLLLGLAILHTFACGRIRRWGHGTWRHWLGEVELVFALWGTLYLVGVAIIDGPVSATRYLGERDFTEPAFVFVIMSVCATRPVLHFASALIDRVARSLPFPPMLSFYGVALVVGPLLGSLITEPAAMTVTALILLERLYARPVSRALRYATLGLLFVNVSVGGTLTPYAAPPILMVAPGWGWDLPFMLTHFGWKGAAACLVSTFLVALRFRGELGALGLGAASRESAQTPPRWLVAFHLAALVAVVLSSHHPLFFFGAFVLFALGVRLSRRYQDPLQLRSAGLVAIFLAGLVVLGGPQRWWLEPLLTRLDSWTLYFGAAALTAITDNAALTYLGAQVPSLSDAARYSLVAGSVVGGGLTVIANAPNPAGFGILNAAFGDEGITPLGLLRAALLPTAVALAFFAI
jgi:hypothetical protein